MQRGKNYTLKHLQMIPAPYTRAIPERLGGVFTMRRYTNPRLPLPLPYKCKMFVSHRIERVINVRCDFPAEVKFKQSVFYLFS